MTTRRVALLVGALAAVGIAWRLIVCFAILPAWQTHNEVSPFPDDYPALAHSLLEHGTLGYGEGRASITTARGPGFPLWLAVGILLGGEDGRWLGLWSSLPILILAAVLAALLGRRYGALPAIAGYLIAACHPLPSLVAARVMSDEFYAACGFGAVLLWVAVLRSPERRWWPLTLAAGCLLALHLLTRSTGLLTLAVLLVLGWRSRHTPRMAIVFLAAVAMLPALAWSLRSSRLEGRFVFVHSLGGYNFWIGEAFDRYGSGWTEQDAWMRSLSLVVAKGGLDPSEASTFHYAKLEPRELAAFDARLSREAVTRVGSDPGGYALRVLRGVPRFWVEGQSRRRTLQYTLAMAPLVLLMAAGIPRVLRGSRAVDLVAVASLGLIVSHNLAYAATLPMARMSIQIFPALAWLGAVGVAVLAGRGGGQVLMWSKSDRPAIP